MCATVQINIVCLHIPQVHITIVFIHLLFLEDFYRSLVSVKDVGTRGGETFKLSLVFDFFFFF